MTLSTEHVNTACKGATLSNPAFADAVGGGVVSFGQASKFVPFGIAQSGRRRGRRWKWREPDVGGYDVGGVTYMLTKKPSAWHRFWVRVVLGWEMGKDAQ